METRVVMFNIKQFIEDYIFCVESKDIEGKNLLLNKFKEVFAGSKDEIKVGIQKYIANSNVAKDYKELQSLATFYCLIQ